MKVKFIILLFNFFFIAFTCISQDTIIPSQAISYIGKTVCVKGKVVGSFYAEGTPEKPTFLHLNKKFPENEIDVFIFDDDRKKINFNRLIYKGKTVVICGEMEWMKNQYEEKPGLKIKELSQITICEK